MPKPCGNGGTATARGLDLLQTPLRRQTTKLLGASATVQARRAAPSRAADAEILAPSARACPSCPLRRLGPFHTVLREPHARYILPQRPFPQALAQLGAPYPSHTPPTPFVEHCVSELAKIP